MPAGSSEQARQRLDAARDALDLARSRLGYYLRHEHNDQHQAQRAIRECANAIVTATQRLAEAHNAVMASVRFEYEGTTNDRP